MILVDLEVQKLLGLNPLQYIVCAVCANYSHIKRGTGISHLSDVIGVESSHIHRAMRHLVDVGLMEKADNGFYYPSTKWYLAHNKFDVEVITSAEKIAGDVIAYFNEVNNTKFTTVAYADKISSILKNNPKLTLDHFKSVIAHKKITWGDDEKMSQYNRPSTIFSSKFIRYLDEANNYWLDEAKTSGSGHTS